MCRGHYPPADEYLNHAEKSDSTLVEAFKRMQVIEDEEPLDPAEENGEPDQEV
jgi:coatomer subunit beta'